MPNPHICHLVTGYQQPVLHTSKSMVFVHSLKTGGQNRCPGEKYLLLEEDGEEVPTDVSKIVYTPCASVLFRSSEYK